MATKKPRNKKYNPDAPKHLVPGKKPVEEYQLDAVQFTQLVLLENIKRQAAEGQTNYLLQQAQKFGYPVGVRVSFDIDWQKQSVRVTILGKAQPAKLKGFNKKENKNE